MRSLAWLCLLLAMLLQISELTAEPRSLDLLSPAVKEKLAKLESKVIDLPLDPTYNDTPSKYEAYRLVDVLKLLGKTSDDAEIIFICGDGYRVFRSVKDLPLARGYLGFRDVNHPGWRPFREGKGTLNPAPYLLLWQGVSTKEDQQQLPWPYKLVEIAVDSGSHTAIVPPTQPEALSKQVEDGHQLFRQNCLSCHSINKDGGVIGPELNVPKNITEYRDSAYLREWIASPTSFRWRARMPGYSYFTKEQMDNLILYLLAMKNRKICDSVEDCGK